MKKIQILCGTMLGGTEYVADMLNDALTNQGLESQVHMEFEQISDLAEPDSFWLVCTSTHGAGDLPDNIEPLLEYLQARPDLRHIKYDVIGIGDRSYDTFNQAAQTLDEELEQCGAVRLSEPLLIDVQEDPLPEEPALNWLTDWYNTHVYQDCE
ncbi:FMN-binding protein MioC [Echinimonas agarilytica]|uniref:FMN-binding protein MioC n=1 Tax=Echinimonas agarilytica TaxID=1215918 RepID=A0AA42B5U2_9GAMM|nr:FMN-binding protein MioC [Echinimonas agarilytica]MCM2678112.1 FMN-binding protein MioC [Echinimonas agarilytica]